MYFSKLINVIVVVFLLVVENGFAQQKFTISGYVKDAETGESFVGATISNIDNKAQATQTNLYGFYSISLIKNTYKLSIDALGKQQKIIEVNLNKSIVQNIELSDKIIEVKEITISAEKSDKNVRSTDMGKIDLSMDKIKSLPAFMGEVDILKAIQLMPGVKTSGDGNSGFYVRGGGPDQNLILLDGAQIYNPFHLLGFFSVFNSNAINNLELYKGAMPANYGGRLASVLDVSMNEGNNIHWKVDGGIGLIASRLTLQGPLVKDKVSCIFSVRRSYADLIISPFLPYIKKAKDFIGTRVYFYDLNAKINWIINDKNRIFLSGYFGQDKFRYTDKAADFSASVPWGNTVSTFRWNHLFSSKIFMNTSVILSDFKFQFKATQDDFEASLTSGIRDVTLKTDFDIFPNILHKTKAGFQYTYHTFTPFKSEAKQADTNFDLGNPVYLYANEAAAYINDEFDWTDWLKINAGLRYSYFRQIGPFDRYVKNEIEQIIDTVSYKAGENIKTYGGFEPRFSVRFTTSKTTSIKMAYTKNYQYLHLASLSGISLPTDVWIPSTSIIKPQIGNQYSVGFYKNFMQNMFEASVEVYYKTMQNQVEFKEGYLPENSVKDNNDYAFVFGKGEAYGIEFFLKKKFGKLDGWVGFTHSYTNRTFVQLNYGKTYYAPYDRRNDASFVLNYKLNNKWSFGAVWVYGTGRPITLPNQRYFFENRLVSSYGLRNSIRMPAYHRMDISATYDIPKKKHIKQSWNFSVFNVYNRLNPFFLYYAPSGTINSGTLVVKLKQVSLFPIIPSVTWNFSF